MLSLEVQERAAKSRREAGSVPAVFYGAKEPSTPILINAKALENTWKSAGETTIVTLKGVGSDKDALIKDVQVHPLSGTILHADFYVLEKGKKIEIAVPLEFQGEAPAEKLGHILVKALHEIEIEVAPNELPHTLAVDLSGLENVGDHVVAADIVLPPSAALKTDPEEIVVSVTAFEEFKEEEIPEGAAPSTEVSDEPAAAESGEKPE